MPVKKIMAEKLVPGKIGGSLGAAGLRFAMVVSRFNSFITERLLAGAVDALERAGAASADVDVVHVPGAFELPLAAKKLALGGRYDALVAIGCVLRGATSHYDYVCSETARGLQLAQMDTGVPVIFCVLTCDTLEQAIDRAGLKGGTKGFEAGLAAIEMAWPAARAALIGGRSNGAALEISGVCHADVVSMGYEPASTGEAGSEFLEEREGRGSYTGVCEPVAGGRDVTSGLGRRGDHPAGGALEI